MRTTEEICNMSKWRAALAALATWGVALFATSPARI